MNTDLVLRLTRRGLFCIGVRCLAIPLLILVQFHAFFHLQIFVGNCKEQNKLNDNPSIEEVRQLAEKYTDVHNDTLSKLGDDLMEMKKNRMDNFDEIIKKFKQDNEKT